MSDIGSSPRQLAIQQAMRQLLIALTDAGFKAAIESNHESIRERVITFKGIREIDDEALRRLHSEAAILTHIPIEDDKSYSVVQYEFIDNE